MFELLNNLVSDIVVGPERRKVRKYLDAATRDTVYADFTKILSWQVKRPQHIQDVFNRYCIEDPVSHEKYWTAESFHDHIRSTHSAGAISGTAIALLWKSFYFYAYHPFPQEPQEQENLGFDAFRRATLLTVFQCDNLLGTRELDWYWRENGAFFRKAGFARIFRSIGVSDHEFSDQQRKVGIVSSCLSDAADVLVMVGPQFIHAVPSELQLEGVARRLFADGPAVARRNAMSREDLLCLIDLLLRLRLQEERWAGSYHFGAVVDTDSAEKDLTEAMVNSLTERCNGQNITVRYLSEQMELLPNLLLRFQQLWAILFQPSGAADVSKLSVEEARLARIGGEISLFAPHIPVDHAGRQRPDEQDSRITLVTEQVLAGPQDLTMLRLCQRLSDDSTAHVVLFTTATGCEAPKMILGAYLPAPNAINVTGINLPRKLDASHILFQLQPTFRLLRWARCETPLANLIHPYGDESFDEAAWGGDSGLPYWIGAPQGQGAGLRVDPRKRTATLTNGEGGFHVKIPIGSDGDHETKGGVTVHNAQMHIFDLPRIGNRNKFPG
ncbi:hypothetical protein F5Y07DRAFT_390319 [Xylaria sp. FL0933]|nr:hypothetical protein F5Y07DRAFT_390319 [Xylaria sp. FL0933]